MTENTTIFANDNKNADKMTKHSIFQNTGYKQKKKM